MPNTSQSRSTLQGSLDSRGIFPKRLVDTRIEQPIRFRNVVDVTIVPNFDSLATIHSLLFDGLHFTHHLVNVGLGHLGGLTVIECVQVDGTRIRDHLEIDGPKCVGTYW